MNGAPNLARHYTALERRFLLKDDSSYEALVAPNGNANLPFHRWFHLKEGFSSQLLGHVVDQIGMSPGPLTLLDPFAGVGTGPLSALTLAVSRAPRVSAYGIERNPFLLFAAQTKLRGLRAHGNDFAAAAELVAARAARSSESPAPPALSTFWNRSYFSLPALKALLRLRTAILRNLPVSLERDLALLCLAASIEPSSSLRRDGRALRFESGKVPADPLDEFTRRSRQIAEDIACCYMGPRRRGRVFLGDARNPSAVLAQGLRANLALFSPPYPNNIDYTEVYKLETWFLGFIRSDAEFRAQRLSTFRSHPSVRFPETYRFNSNGHRRSVNRILGPVLDSLPPGRYADERARLIRGYFDDLLTTLQGLRPFLAAGAYVVFVVANSLHGRHPDDGVVIASDILAAAIAELAGYEVDSIRIARTSSRQKRATHFARESVIFLRLADAGEE
jgi:hypothetical protein